MKRPLVLQDFTGPTVSDDNGPKKEEMTEKSPAAFRSARGARHLPRHLGNGGRVRVL